MKINISLSNHQQYRYAMVNRPIGISCQPKEGMVGGEDRPARGHAHYDMARNGVAVYNRRLTDHETKQFEMAHMVDGADREEYADQVIEEMGEYAPRYAQLAAKRPDEFEGHVFDKLKSGSKGYPPSVGDRKLFAQLVLKRIAQNEN